MKIIISLGGSLLTRELSAKNFKKYADVLIKLKKKGHKLVVVCGGGKTAREYQKIVKDYGVSKELQDMIGIVATHLNAMTLLPILKNYAFSRVLKTPTEVKKYFNKKILVCAGNLPGHSTDYDAALFAKAVKADLLINATNIDGVYSSDPRKNPKAKKFDKLSYKDFEKIISKNLQAPGKYGLFDLKATKLIRKEKIRTVIINATNPEEIIKAMKGKHKGTIIS